MVSSLWQNFSNIWVIFAIQLSPFRWFVPPLYFCFLVFVFLFQRARVVSWEGCWWNFTLKSAPKFPPNKTKCFPFVQRVLEKFPPNKTNVFLLSREPASWRVGAGDSDDTSPLAPKIDLLLLQLTARKTKTKTKTIQRQIQRHHLTARDTKTKTQPRCQNDKDETKDTLMCHTNAHGVLFPFT